MTTETCKETAVDATTVYINAKVRLLSKVWQRVEGDFELGA